MQLLLYIPICLLGHGSLTPSGHQAALYRVGVGPCWAAPLEQGVVTAASGLGRLLTLL